VWAEQGRSVPGAAARVSGHDEDDVRQRTWDCSTRIGPVRARNGLGCNDCRLQPTCSSQPYGVRGGGAVGRREQKQAAGHPAPPNANRTANMGWRLTHGVKEAVRVFIPTCAGAKLNRFRTNSRPAVSCRVGASSNLMTTTLLFQRRMSGVGARRRVSRGQKVRVTRGPVHRSRHAGLTLPRP